MVEVIPAEAWEPPPAFRWNHEAWEPPPAFQWKLEFSAGRHLYVFDHGDSPEDFATLEHCASPIDAIRLYDRIAYQRTRFHNMGLHQWCETHLRGKYIVRAPRAKHINPVVWFDDAWDAIHFKMRWT